MYCDTICLRDLTACYFILSICYICQFKIFQYAYCQFATLAPFFSLIQLDHNENDPIQHLIVIGRAGLYWMRIVKNHMF